MIKLYTWKTPNGRKISIALEELELAYEVHPIDIMKDEQFAPEFLAISPNNKIPAIVDTETGVSVFESGAILLYLANKTGRLTPAHASAEYWDMLQWLFWQVGGFGPMLGQAHHFLQFNQGKAPYAEDRYHNEAKRLYAVLDQRLEGREFIMGDELSVADIAIWPWSNRFDWQRIDLADFANVRRWYMALANRPAFERGYAQPEDTGPIPMPE